MKHVSRLMYDPDTGEMVAVDGHMSAASWALFWDTALGVVCEMVEARLERAKLN